MIASVGLLAIRLGPCSLDPTPNSGSVSGIVKQALRNIGLDSERYAAHSLRHSSITYALMAGATLEETQKMARHADISTTMIYAHHVDRVRSNAEARVSGCLDEVL